MIDEFYKVLIRLARKLNEEDSNVYQLKFVVLITFLVSTKCLNFIKFYLKFSIKLLEMFCYLLQLAYKKAWIKQRRSKFFNRKNKLSLPTSVRSFW